MKATVETTITALLDIDTLTPEFSIALAPEPGLPNNLSYIMAMRGAAALISTVHEQEGPGLQESAQTISLNLAVNLDPTADVLRDIINERKRQVDEKGYTTEHDDTLSVAHMVDFTTCYMEDGKEPHGRDALVKSAALLIATIQRYDREFPKPEPEAEPESDSTD